MKYRLRTLLILLAFVPMVLAAAWWLWPMFGWGLLPLFLIFGLPPLLIVIVPELGPLIRWLLSK